jgi:hypothetical protein
LVCKETNYITAIHEGNMKKSISLLALILALGIYTTGPIVMKTGPFAAGVAHADDGDGGGDGGGNAGSHDDSNGGADSNDDNKTSDNSADSRDDNGTDDDVTGIDNPDDVAAPAAQGAAKSVACNWVGCAG